MKPRVLIIGDVFRNPSWYFNTDNKYEEVDWETAKNVDVLYIYFDTPRKVKSHIYKHIKIKHPLGGKFVKKFTSDKGFFHNFVRQQNKKLFQRFFMEQRDIDNNFVVLEKLKPHKYYIVKPIPGSSGDGIKVFKGDQVDDIKQHIKSNNVIMKNGKIPTKPKWVIQRYMENPLLLKGKKFHLRVIGLVFKDTLHLYKESMAFPAKKKYTLENTDPDSHDSHVKSSSLSEKMTFPTDFYSLFSQTKQVYDDMIFMMKELKKIDLFELSCHGKNEQCYRFIGFDMMITDQFDIKCIEANGKPGMGQQAMPRIMPNLINGMIDIITSPNNESEYYEKI